jgi:hypothetical protein
MESNRLRRCGGEYREAAVLGVEVLGRERCDARLVARSGPRRRERAATGWFEAEEKLGQGRALKP